MNQLLCELLQQCTVKLKVPGEMGWGTGFFVAPGLILTCAHVVKAAGIEPVKVGWQNQDDFAEAKIEGFLSDSFDLALLRLSSSFNDLPYVYLDKEIQPNDNIYIYGYSDDFPGGDPVTVECEGLTGDKQPLIKFKNGQVRPGLSGSPLLNQRTGKVCGIVKFTRDRSTDLGGGAVPTSVIFSAFPDLEVKNRSFHQTDERWTKPRRSFEQGRPEGAIINTRVFISYNDEEPDLSLAKEFYQGLKAAQYQVFMAKESLKLGDNWPQRLDEEINACDYFLVLLSFNSANRQMIREEVRRAKELREKPANRKPVILPILVNCEISSLNYDLRGYLYGIKYREWRSPDDTPIILQNILDILARGDTPEPEATVKVLPIIEPVQENPNVRPSPVAPPVLPPGQLTDIYVERSPIEEQCYDAILNPDTALIRIKAPKFMGKTKLMARILYKAREQNYRTVPLSFKLAEEEIFTDKDLFLQWFCGSVAEQLKLPNNLHDYWSKGSGSKANCTAYFEKYLLVTIDQPLVLVLDGVDLVFPYTEIASNFFELLRSWHEKRQYSDIWKKLRLVLVHSTEVYIKLDINHSPFNVGRTIKLRDFSHEEVQSLARKYKLDEKKIQVDDLMALVGGHPYLLGLAFYELEKDFITIKELLKTATTDTGIYSDHLNWLWWELKDHPELADSMRKLLATDSPVQLEEMQAFKLNSFGLVALLQGNNQVTIRYNLYRQYFRAKFGVTP